MREEKPFAGRPYAVPFSKRGKVAKEIENMKDMGIIEVSNSEYSNLLVCVVKKDKSIRLCLDSRKLNEYIIPDTHGTELTEEIFQKFVGAKYFSSIDLSSGFFQVMLYI